MFRYVTVRSNSGNARFFHPSVKFIFLRRRSDSKLLFSAFRNKYVGSLKGLCQLESIRSEVMQITFNCQNSIVLN